MSPNYYSFAILKLYVVLYPLAPHEKLVSCCHHHIPAFGYNLGLIDQPYLLQWKIFSHPLHLQGSNQVLFLKMPEWLSKRMIVKKQQCWNPIAYSLKWFSVPKIQEIQTQFFHLLQKRFKVSSYIFQEND